MLLTVFAILALAGLAVSSWLIWKRRPVARLPEQVAPAAQQDALVLAMATAMTQMVQVQARPRTPKVAPPGRSVPEARAVRSAALWGFQPGAK